MFNWCPVVIVYTLFLDNFDIFKYTFDILGLKKFVWSYCAFIILENESLFGLSIFKLALIAFKLIKDCKNGFNLESRLVKSRINFLNNRILLNEIDVFFFKKYYLNNDSTKLILSNNWISSIPSPTPIYLIGIFNWSQIEITTPPFAVPSNLVNAK